MKTSVYSKEAEIKALRELIKMGGYFAECFGDDIEQIVANIGNDHPFVFNTAMENMFYESQKHLRDLCDRMLTIYESTGDSALRAAVGEEMGEKRLIMRKHALGFVLTKEEIDFLIFHLEK
jgi:hypothetical protein